MILETISLIKNQRLDQSDDPEILAENIRLFSTFIIYVLLWLCVLYVT